MSLLKALWMCNISGLAAGVAFGFWKRNPYASVCLYSVLVFCESLIWLALAALREQ